jgi:hypothetical protein
MPQTYAHQKINNPAPAAGDKLKTYSAALGVWVLTTLTQLVSYVATALNITSGQYTPTGTIVGNLDSLTPGTFNYARLGSFTIVFGRCTIDPTAASAFTFGLSLSPAALSNFTGGDQAVGFAGGAGLSGGRVTGDATNDRLDVIGTASGTTSTNMYIIAGYQAT